MIWKTIVGYSKYEVSEYGQVRRALCEPVCYKGKPGSRLKPGMLLKPKLTKHGYLMFVVFNDDVVEKTITAHHAVALGFCGPRPTPKHYALHWDDKPLNNHYSNLRWGTAKQNAQDALRNGLIRRGSNLHNSKLTEHQVREIRKRFPAEGKTLKEFGVEFGVSLHTIRLIVKMKTWLHVEA